MGLFDVFQKGGKYFGKDIQPHCEYCEFGKRAKDGNKVLCDKRGLVDADFHCGKFTYSPLKRIPVKQLNRVGFSDIDDEFIDGDEETTETPAPVEKKQEVAPLELPEEKPAPVTEPAPAPVETPVEAAPAPAPVEEPAAAPVAEAHAIDEIAAPEIPAAAPAPVEAPAEAPAAMDAETAEQQAADLAAEEALRALEKMNL